MQIFKKIGIKAIISVVVGVLMGRENILLGMGMAAICYVLLSYYVWYMKRRGGGFSVFLGQGGLMATLGSIAFMVLSPLIPIIVLALLLNTLHVPDVVESVLSILLVIAAAGFVVLDIGRAINPEFLKNVKIGGKDQ